MQCHTTSDYEMNAEQQTTVTRKFVSKKGMKVKTAEEEEIVRCPHCKRTEKECEEQATNEKNPITEWMGGWGLSCDDCYYENHPESEEEEEDDDATETDEEEEESEEEEEESEEEEDESEPESEDAECQTDPLPVGVTERRVYDVVDAQVLQCHEDFEERLADMRRQIMEETERMISARMAQLAGGHPTIQKQSKKAEKEAKRQEEIKGYYEVPAGVDELARSRKICADLRKQIEGKTKTNQKLQERIEELEGEDPVRVYAEDVKRLKEINQKLRKRCEAKDRTYQKMKAMIEELGGKAPAKVADSDDEE
jgi:uncharacterized coiled-coil protein SlyX